LIYQQQLLGFVQHLNKIVQQNQLILHPIVCLLFGRKKALVAVKVGKNSGGY
jgi:hypothetical protein